MPRRRYVFGAVLAICVAGTLPAHAATEPKRPTPAVVASDGAVTLNVADTDDALCLGLELGGSSETCDNAELGEAIAGRTARGTRFVGAAVPAAAATIEVRRAGLLLASGPTVAGAAYTGKRAGTLRFALVRLASGARQDGLRVRALAAGGALVAVLAVSGEPDLVFGRRRLLSGRSGTVRWSIVSSQSSALAPSVLDAAHEVVSRCVEVRVTGGRETSNSGACLGLAPRDSPALFGGASVDAAVEDRCTPDFRLVHGVADAAVKRVVVVLGDGSRRVARLAPVGDATHSAYALILPRAAAVRSITLDSGAAGSRVLPIGGAPLAVICASNSATLGSGLGVSGASLSLLSPFGAVPPVAPVGPVTTIAGSPAMRVADGPGDSLCVAVGDRPFTALGCSVVSPLLSEVLGTYDDLNDPHAFALALPARVATLRIAGPRGQGTRDIPTVPATGYAGPYAGFVRFAAATIADLRELSRIEYLDGAGSVLFREDTTGATDLPPAPQVSPARRIAGRSGRPSLWQTDARISGESLHCLALTSGPRPAREDACQAVRSRRSVLLGVPCATHRLTVAVVAVAGTRVLASVGRSRTRSIALRRGAGVLTLPAGTWLRALTFAGNGRRTRLRLDAPPGSSQCGWTFAQR